MQTLMSASNELFRRGPDERFDSLQALYDHCHATRTNSIDRWHPPQSIEPAPHGNRFRVTIGDDGDFSLSDWSFGQLCRLAGVSKETVNRVSAGTAAQIFRETMPSGDKPLQLLTQDDAIRSIHGTAYTRLHNVDLLNIVREFATDFQPPQTACNGGTGLYCGEQDMFVFLIDPLGWAEINGEAFAPGFFLWNSEVGKRSVGMQTFWFQAVCQNHIVWDAVEVIDFTRKHTANVHECLGEVRRLIANLVEKRDQRRDGFVTTIGKAMETTLGSDADEVMKLLAKQGIPRSVAKEALELARTSGRFTIFNVVDALTRLAGRIKNAGERTEADERAGALLALAV
ncbi:MAG: DUF932 domain-containing protein [Planctomycetes bacterium]|nr:DUF932 domain-containing protein [Planctomycetota bacterium]